MKSRQTGFTLVEIAIVLVIIGLLLGGVLKGQELITQAKIKNIANDFNQITAAVYGYQDRYRKLPGDDNGAESRWPTKTKNGNGSGTIDGEFYTNSDVDGVEPRLFWQHLRLAGFIIGDPTSRAQPINAVGGIIGAQTGVGPDTALELPGPVLCSTNLPGKFAIAVDNMFDDGNPHSGSVRGFKQSGSLVAQGTGNDSPVNKASETSYVEDDVILYTVCRQL
ncbi:MAG: prepilin-type N-terminal cleavage/methylation domain-containing protein [Desulfobulbus sp.]|nr:prepilin-type N-terminal cleavage/methylation domain-containing protein [Desulfobulbus sp.]